MIHNVAEMVSVFLQGFSALIVPLFPHQRLKIGVGKERKKKEKEEEEESMRHSD